MAAHRDELPRCLQLLAAKGAQELVLVNRPTPIQAHLQLPGALLACAAFLTPEGEGGGEQAAGGGKPAQLASSRGVGKPARGRGGGLPARSQAGEELALGGAGRQRREELARGFGGGGEHVAGSGVWSSSGGGRR